MELLHFVLQNYHINLIYNLYKDDLDLSKLKTQLSMLLDLIVTRNSRNSVPIKKVTNVRTICDIINETSVGS